LLQLDQKDAVSLSLRGFVGSISQKAADGLLQNPGERLFSAPRKTL